MAEIYNPLMGEDRPDITKSNSGARSAPAKSKPAVSDVSTKGKIGTVLGSVATSMQAAQDKNAASRSAVSADLQANARQAPGPSYTPTVPIPDFNKASPATFHKGGTVKRGGLALVKKGELYMPPEKVAKLKKDIVRLMDKSFGR